MKVGEIKRVTHCRLIAYDYRSNKKIFDTKYESWKEKKWDKYDVEYMWGGVKNGFQQPSPHTNIQPVIYLFIKEEK